MDWDKIVARKCPSCMQEWDTCVYILFFHLAGHVETLKHTIDIIEDWIVEAETEPDLLDCIVEYADGWGGRSMTDICKGLGPQYMQMARDQDAIGWRRFMEGIICKQIREIQNLYHFQEGTRMPLDQWAQDLILELLVVTHGQWIYRNIQIHTVWCREHRQPLGRRGFDGRSRNRWSYARWGYWRKIIG
jgi:hypothetical protein